MTHLQPGTTFTYGYTHTYRYAVRMKAGSGKYKQLTLFRPTWVQRKDSSEKPRSVDGDHWDDINRDPEKPLGLEDGRAHSYTTGDLEKVSPQGLSQEVYQEGLTSEQRVMDASMRMDDFPATARGTSSHSKTPRLCSTGKSGDGSARLLDTCRSSGAATSSGGDGSRSRASQCVPHPAVLEVALRKARVMDSESTESPKSQSRLRLARLTLSETEDTTKADQSDEPAIRRKRKRVPCRSSRRKSKQVKRSVQEEPGTDERVPVGGDQINDGEGIPGSDVGHSSTEGTDAQNVEEQNVDCPMPSTRQQKEARRLARLRQLKEMRARETMDSRRERALKRRGEQSSSKRSSGMKRVSWKEESSLAKVMK